MIVELHHLVTRGLAIRREPTTAPDCGLFDTRSQYWFGFDDQAGRRFWSCGPTFDEGRQNALSTFQELSAWTDERPILIAQETRIAPDGTYWLVSLPFCPAVSTTANRRTAAF
jgi:hypothetical protein